MKLLVDTNVILDFLLQRDGFYEAARELIIRESESSAELVSASAITDIHYTVVSALKKTGLAETEPEASMNSQQRIAQLLSFVSIVPVNRANIDYALELAWVDFEDAVQYSVAVANGVDYIVTRDQKGFREGDIPFVTPTEVLKIIAEIKAADESPSQLNPVK